MKFKPIVIWMEFKEGIISIESLKDNPSIIKFKKRYLAKDEFLIAIKAKEKAYYKEFVWIEDNLLFIIYNIILFN